MQHNSHGGVRWLGAFAVVGAFALFVWPERGHAQAPSRYEIASEGTLPGGTVYDTKTDLTWQREAPPVAQAWAAAQVHCPTLGEGWRVPSFKELATLGAGAVQVDREVFAEPTAQSYSDGDGGQRYVSDQFWAAPSTTGTNSDGKQAEMAYVVGASGGVDLVFTATAADVRTRCVRTGRP